MLIKRVAKQSMGSQEKKYGGRTISPNRDYLGTILSSCIDMLAQSIQLQNLGANFEGIRSLELLNHRNYENLVAWVYCPTNYSSFRPSDISPSSFKYDVTKQAEIESRLLAAANNIVGKAEADIMYVIDDRVSEVL